jgi:hypothetical protein
MKIPTTEIPLKSKNVKGTSQDLLRKYKSQKKNEKMQVA